MKKRWPLQINLNLITRVLSLVLFCMTTFSTKAESSASPILNEAEKLIEISPSRSKQIALNYLSTRKLISDSQEISASRENAEKTIRTPITTINALQILAKSKMLMKNALGVLENIDEAISIAEKHNLDNVLIESQILKADILWQLSGDVRKVSPIISNIDQKLKKVKVINASQNSLTYLFLMLQGKIASQSGNIESADEFFSQASQYADKSDNPETVIKHQIALGEHDLRHQRLNRALYDLLAAYWTAIESDNPVLLAKANHLLATTFFRRQALDRAIDHLLRAADFYDNYSESTILPRVLKQMADIYYLQGKYNLALVHYFNVLDTERNSSNIEDIIELRLSLAKTYLQLYNYPLAEQYLSRASSLLSDTDLILYQAKALLLGANLDFRQGHYASAVTKAFSALETGRQYKDYDVQLRAHSLLSSSHEKLNEYKLAYKHGKHYNTLITNRKNELLAISEDDFIQQKKFIENSLHYQDQQDKLSRIKKELRNYQNILMLLFALSTLILLYALRKGTLYRKLRKELAALYEDHYTHPRSGLRNLRLLNLKLPSSLERSSANYEQWQTGELINEPLHDRLRFIMIDLPFLRNMYLNGGYHAGLELESEFGTFIKSKIEKPARLYHFSDALFLYVEPNTDPDKAPEDLFNKVTGWIDEFNTDKEIDRCIRAGIADYPFLPRAYTAINDKELIDILLMASNIARTITLEEGGSQWAYLKAIKNAPAASFAGSDMRSACNEAIEKGLIKILTSRKNGDDIKKSVVA